MSQDVAWPRKTRELHSHHFDSTIWNDFSFRDDDIVIATYAKSGTTWMQQIIAQMLFGPDPELEVAAMSPWLDLRVPPKEVKLPAVEAQAHRRFPRRTCPSMRSCSRRRRSTSTSAATRATSYGASTTTT
jgi:aryl sulfotransferase